MPIEGVFSGGASLYVGPGDVMPGAQGWWGLRAYSNAAIGRNVVTIRRSSDNSTKTFVSLPSGNITTFDSFFDGSSYFIVTLYDQTGNGFDVTMATTAQQPGFVLGGLGGLPAMTLSGSQWLANISFSSFGGQPFSASFVANCTSGNSDGRIFTSGSSTFVSFTPSGAANSLLLFAGNVGSNVTASDNTWHAIQCSFNGASSVGTVDGSSTAVDAGTAHWPQNDIVPGATSPASGGHTFIGSAAELGLWPQLGFSGTQASALNSNQHGYWHF